MEDWITIWEARSIFLNGFATTLEIFLSSSFIAFFIGLVLLYLLESSNKAGNGLIMLFVNGMRTIPFLVFAYLLYYGLPELGIRLNGYVAGLIGLALYHGAYFCEILLSRRRIMPNGLIEAALAHGFKKRTLFVRMILPNTTMNSLPLLGNQLINCLKDSAFLSILTVEEITFAANNIQSIHYIPIKTFACAIALYWAITLTIEFVMNKIIKIGNQKGFNHA